MVVLPSELEALTLYLPASSLLARVTLSLPLGSAMMRLSGNASAVSGTLPRVGDVHLYSISGGLAFAGSSIRMDLPSSTVKVFSSDPSAIPTNSGLSEIEIVVVMSPEAAICPTF